jgi:hypothetical protein
MVQQLQWTPWLVSQDSIQWLFHMGIEVSSESKTSTLYSVRYHYRFKFLEYSSELVRVLRLVAQELNVIFIHQKYHVSPLASNKWGNWCLLNSFLLSFLFILLPIFYESETWSLFLCIPLFLELLESNLNSLKSLRTSLSQHFIV